jgi:hypothetical protein
MSPAGPPAASQRPAPVTLDCNPPQDAYFTRHAKYVPKSRLWQVFAQVRGVPGTV